MLVKCVGLKARDGENARPPLSLMYIASLPFPTLNFPMIRYKSYSNISEIEFSSSSIYIIDLYHSTIAEIFYTVLPDLPISNRVKFSSSSIYLLLLLVPWFTNFSFILSHVIIQIQTPSRIKVSLYQIRCPCFLTLVSHYAAQFLWISFFLSF